MSVSCKHLQYKQRKKISATYLSAVLFLLTLFHTGFCIDNVDVVIIGGGASGIAAATKLDNHGVKFVLLEAESRLGGRVHSVPFGDAKVDLGAEWVHGEKGNIVNEMMKDTGLLHHSTQPYKIYSSNREDISEEFSEELINIFFEISEFTDDNATIDESIGEAFVRRYVQVINDKYVKDKTKINFALQALPLFEKYVCSLEASPNWYLSSAIKDWVPCEGDTVTHWNGKGYYTALEYLMRNFNSSDKMFINKTVNKIEYGGNKAVVKGDDFKYEAKYVLFTPSLGVLKHSHLDLFDPPLSEKKTEAIDKHGFGAVGKVWMHFAEPWWNKVNFTDFNLAWTCADKLTLRTQFPKGPKRNGQTWLGDLFSVIDTPQNPNVLAAWFAGEFIGDIENMSDDLLIEGIVFALEKFVGHLYTVQKPDKILCGKWHSNKHFRGTYSYQTMASRKMQPGSIKVLAEPVNNLFFAGEATNMEHYGTVNGAIETGYREAERLIKLIDGLKQ